MQLQRNVIGQMLLHTKYPDFGENHFLLLFLLNALGLLSNLVPLPVQFKKIFLKKS